MDMNKYEIIQKGQLVYLGPIIGGAGEKIKAIKLIRELTEFGLTESKNFIEATHCPTFWCPGPEAKIKEVIAQFHNLGFHFSRV